MYELEFYIYHLQPYGIVRGTQHLNHNPMQLLRNDLPDLRGNTQSKLPVNAFVKSRSEKLFKRRSQGFITR